MSWPLTGGLTFRGVGTPGKEKQAQDTSDWAPDAESSEILLKRLA